MLGSRPADDCKAKLKRKWTRSWRWILELEQPIARVVRQLKKFIDDNYKKFTASTSLQTVMKDTKSVIGDTANTFADGFSDAFDKVYSRARSGTP